MGFNNQGLFAHLFESAPNDWEIKNLPDIVDFQEGTGILAKDFHDRGVDSRDVTVYSGIKNGWPTHTFIIRTELSSTKFKDEK